MTKMFISVIIYLAFMSACDAKDLKLNRNEKIVELANSEIKKSKDSKKFFRIGQISNTWAVTWQSKSEVYLNESIQRLQWDGLWLVCLLKTFPKAFSNDFLLPVEIKITSRDPIETISFLYTALAIIQLTASSASFSSAGFYIRIQGWK